MDDWLIATITLLAMLIVYVIMLARVYASFFDNIDSAYAMLSLIFRCFAAAAVITMFR